MSTAGGGGAGTGGAGGASGSFELDCGPIGWAVEAHGPPANRVNYVIIGDGYTAADLVAGGTFEQHIARAMNKRFSVPIGEVYSRYRRFVNICALKLESSGSICGGSPLGCFCDAQSRLAECDNREVNAALAANLPESFVVDWRAVVLNGSSWWNTGSATMLWSGGHPDAGGAALHEGGHGFHQLADEYTGSGSGCTQEYAEVNSTADPTTTAGKWDRWLGYDQAGATGLQTTIEGSRYCTAGQYRPSDNSMNNMLFGDDPNTSFNSVSREQMIFTIWRAVEPVDGRSPRGRGVEPRHAHRPRDRSGRDRRRLVGRRPPSSSPGAGSRSTSGRRGSRPEPTPSPLGPTTTPVTTWCGTATAPAPRRSPATTARVRPGAARSRS
jgi:hypothetical protein